jgi:hypothetical protein
MRSVVISCSLLALLMGGCHGQGKQEIGLVEGQVYKLQPSGKLQVFPAAASDGAAGSVPLKKLQVKRKNEGSAATTAGCWQCTDCICNTDDCSCTECTSC